MKTYKQMITALFTGSLLLCSIALQAQGHPGQHRGPGLFQALDHMKAELQLTEDQQSQLEVLKTAFREDIEALKDKDFESREDHRTAFQGLMKEYKGSIDEILTDEQKAILETKKAEHRENRQGRMDKGKRGALRSEVDNYRDQNILPVMREQRAKLEKKINTEDKAQIAKLRATFEAHRKEMEALKNKPDHSREDFQAVRESHKADREALKVMVDKYETDIDALLAEIEGQQEQWHNDMRAIHEKYAPEGERRAGKKGPKGQRQEKGEKKGKAPMGVRQEHPEMRRGHFLLMDPNAANAPATKQAVTKNIKVFPNPATEQMTLEYTLLEKGDVRVELRDKEGNMIKLLDESRKDAGNYSVVVDASQLQEGVYYLTIISQGQVASQKAVVSKR